MSMDWEKSIAILSKKKGQTRLYHSLAHHLVECRRCLVDFISSHNNHSEAMVSAPDMESRGEIADTVMVEQIVISLAKMFTQMVNEGAPKLDLTVPIARKDMN